MVTQFYYRIVTVDYLFYCFNFILQCAKKKGSTIYQWGGTAWVFSKRAFATAGHAAEEFYYSDVEEMVVVLGLHSKFTNPKDSNFRTIKITHAELNYAPWKVIPDYGIDWGILETEEDIFDVEKPNINCFSIANKSLTKNDKLSMIGYFQDLVINRNYEQYIQENQDICTVGSDYLKSKLDTWKGASGSPVFTSDGCAVAIHQASISDYSIQTRIDKKLFNRMNKYREIYDNKNPNLFSYTISYAPNGGDKNEWNCSTKRVILKDGNTYKDYCAEDSKLSKNYFKNSKGTFYGWTVKNTSGKWLYKNSKGATSWRSESQDNTGWTRVFYSDQQAIPANILSETDAKNGENLTMVANWIRFTIKYNSNGGNLNNKTMADTTVTYGVTEELSKNVFQKSGEHFIGWYAYRASDQKWLYKSNSDSTQKWYTESEAPAGWSKCLYKDGTKIAKTSSVDKDVITMYAQWEKTFNVIYNKNDSNASGSMAKTVVTYGTSTALRANAFTNPNKVFIGWYANRKSDNKWYYDSADGKGAGWYLKSNVKNGVLHLYRDQAKVAKTSGVDNDDVIMYAKWAIKGDVNRDGKVTLKDASAVQRYSVKLCTFDYEQKLIADFNGDGQITVSDAYAIQRYVTSL